MHMPDAFAETVEPIQDALALGEARAVEVVASIEHQSEQVRVGHVKETGNFFRRLDIAGAMVMESCRKPGLLTHSTSNALGTASKGFPLRQAQAHLWCDTTGVLCTYRVRAVGVGENDECPLTTCCRGRMNSPVGRRGSQ